jgi:hypothetical protein
MGKFNIEVIAKQCAILLYGGQRQLTIKDVFLMKCFSYI